MSDSSASRTSLASMARRRSRPASRRKQVSSASALTSQGWPRVRVQILSRAGGGEDLAAFPGVLPEQRQDLLSCEVAQTQRARLDVEGTASGDDLLLRARVDAIVTHVAHAAEHHALGKAFGAAYVPRAQLAQHRQEGVAHQRVDLVDEQHQRPRIRLGPATQHLAQGASRSRSRQNARPYFLEEIVTQRRTRPGRQLIQDGAHRLLHVFAGGLPGLDVRVHAAIVALGAAVEQIPQRQKSGGLARLARRVEDEVPLVADEAEHIAEIQTLQRGNAVVLPGADRAGSIEKAHGGKYCTATRGGALPQRDRFTLRLVRLRTRPWTPPSPRTFDHLGTRGIRPRPLPDEMVHPTISFPHKSFRPCGSTGRLT